MDLTTTDRVKVHLEADGELRASSLQDAQLSALIAHYSAAAERYMGRTVATGATTQYLDVAPRQQAFVLDAYPVSSISAVYSDDSRGFTSDAISSDYYSLQGATGLLRMDAYYPASGPGTLKVVYTGGMAASAASFAASYPDIAAAIDMQIVYHISRRGSLGGTSYSGPEGTGVAWTGQLDWLRHVRAVLDRHRRVYFA